MDYARAYQKIGEEMHKVLLIEDSQEIFIIVNQAIGQGVQLHWAQTIGQAKDLLGAHQFDLALLDIELPDGNGIEFCAQIQSLYPHLSIFFLSAHTDLSQKVLGFSAGADDFITKPFAPLELRARVEAKIKKMEMAKHASLHLKWKEIEIEKSKQEVSILESDGPKKIKLSALEFKLLSYFATRPGDVIPREQILNDIWGQEIHIYPRSVDTHISKLRKKLESMSHVIESIHGVGYKFSPSAIDAREGLSL